VLSLLDIRMAMVILCIITDDGQGSFDLITRLIRFDKFALFILGPLLRYNVHLEVCAFP
jgi:hypothetical protein